ncbi:hypothetical protein ABZ569_32315 [Streptomyces albus]
MRPQRYVQSWRTHKAEADKAATAAEKARRTADEIRRRRIAGGAR